jgi:hypothetical protein
MDHDFVSWVALAAWSSPADSLSNAFSSASVLSRSVSPVVVAGLTAVALPTTDEATFVAGDTGFEATVVGTAFFGVGVVVVLPQADKAMVAAATGTRNRIALFTPNDSGSYSSD